MKAQESPLNPKTRYKFTQGVCMIGSKMYRRKICICVTHDSKGKSLSLEDGERMLTIPLEGMEDLINVTF